MLFKTKVQRYHRATETPLYDYIRFTTARADAADIFDHYMPSGASSFGITINQALISGPLSSNIDSI